MKSLAPCLFLSGLILSLALSSCLQKKRKSIYFVQLPKAEWHREDTLRFEFFVPHSQSSFQLQVLLRLNNEFDWLELPIGYIIYNSIGFEKRGQVTVMVAKAPRDFKNFKGSYRQFEVALDPLSRLPEAGLYEILLYPLYDKSLLRVVENVGVATTFL